MTDGRLRIRYIEPKAKKVVRAPNFKQNITLSPTANSKFVLLNHFILSGKEVPEYFYPSDTQTGLDTMLGQFGILHLHLNGNELVYLIQYPDFVSLIAVSDHRHFENERPPGSTLAGNNPNPIPKPPSPPVKVDPAKVKAGILPRKTPPPKTDESFMRRMINIVTETFRNGNEITKSEEHSTIFTPQQLAVLPKRVADRAAVMLSDASTYVVGDSDSIDGYSIETHTIGCREYADQPEDEWWDRHFDIYDEYKNDGISIVAGDPTDKFVTVTPERKKF